MWFVLAAREDKVGVAAVSLLVIVAGYLFLAGLFYLMVYRPGRRERQERQRRASQQEPDAEASGGRAAEGP